MSEPLLLVATRNRHKLIEVRQILARLAPLQPISLDDAGVAFTHAEDELEAFASFAENAAAKARFFAERTGLATLADDSGLCVDVLGGAPGVHSKRFSGRSDLTGDALDEANNRHLLHRLAGVPVERRSAHYLCALALADATGIRGIAEGRCEGVILLEPRGTGGFGYDPLFWIPDEAATFAELAPTRKNLLSHRHRALRAVAPLLRHLDPLSPR